MYLCNSVVSIRACAQKPIESIMHRELVLFREKNESLNFEAVSKLSMRTETSLKRMHAFSVDIISASSVAGSSKPSAGSQRGCGSAGKIQEVYAMFPSIVRFSTFKELRSQTALRFVETFVQSRSASLSHGWFSRIEMLGFIPRARQLKYRVFRHELHVFWVRNLGQLSR